MHYIGVLGADAKFPEPLVILPQSLSFSPRPNIFDCIGVDAAQVVQAPSPRSPQQSAISSGQLVSGHPTLAIRHYLFSNGPLEAR